MILTQIGVPTSPTRMTISRWYLAMLDIWVWIYTYLGIWVG